MDVIPKTKTPGCGSRFWSKESGHTGTQQVANWGESGEYWSDWVLMNIWNIWYSTFCLFLDWILERSRWIMIVYLRFFGYWGSHLFSKHGRSLLGGFSQSGPRAEMSWGSFPAGWFGPRHTWIFYFHILRCLNGHIDTWQLACHHEWKLTWKLSLGCSQLDRWRQRAPLVILNYVDDKLQPFLHQF